MPEHKITSAALSGKKAHIIEEKRTFSFFSGDNVRSVAAPLRRLPPPGHCPAGASASWTPPYPSQNSSSHNLNPAATSFLANQVSTRDFGIISLSWVRAPPPKRESGERRDIQQGGRGRILKRKRRRERKEAEGGRRQREEEGYYKYHKDYYYHQQPPGGGGRQWLLLRLLLLASSSSPLRPLLRPQYVVDRFSLASFLLLLILFILHLLLPLFHDISTKRRRRRQVKGPDRCR